MGDFLEYWFKGLEKGIEGLPESERVSLFTQCGKACSDSYTKAIYQEIWKRTKDIPKFFQQLNYEIEAIDVNEIMKEKDYEITYHACLCDLYKNGYITSGYLCECSRQSLLYNLSILWPDRELKVDLLDSILRGGNKCVLRVFLNSK